MGLLDNLLAFAGGMHISAKIIIGIILFIFFLSLAFSIILRWRYSILQRELDRQSAAGRTAFGSSDGRTAFGTSDGRTAFGTSDGRTAFGTSGGRNASGSSDGRNAFGTSDGRKAHAISGGQDGSPAFDRFSEPRFKNALLRGAVSEFEAAFTAQKGIEVNTQAIIETIFNRRMRASLFQERFAHGSVSMMIVLGLLGTFIGLTLSVQSLVLLFRGYEVTELLSSVESGLLSSLVGMSTAFTTSLFGIACSAIITALNIFISPGQARERLVTALEEYLDDTVSARLRAAAGDGYERMNEALRSTFIEFGEKIAERFDRSLLMMRDDIRGIDEANNNLRNTIEQMDVSLVKISDSLKSSTRYVDENYKTVVSLSSYLKETGEAFDAARKDSELRSEILVKSVTEAAEAINGLTADLRGEAQRRLDNFATYDAAVNGMARSAILIRDAVAAIPEQMFAYSEGSRMPSLAARPARESRQKAAQASRDTRDALDALFSRHTPIAEDDGSGGEAGGSPRGGIADGSEGWPADRLTERPAEMPADEPADEPEPLDESEGGWTRSN